MADVHERKQIVREIEKSESIRKTGKIEEDIALHRHFKPLIKPLRLFDNSGVRQRENRAMIT